MKLVIGGAYQGKGEYVSENYRDMEVVRDFHMLVLELIKGEVDPVRYIAERLPEYRNKVIICDDISCGVVPIDPLTRKWREVLGHTLAVVARESDEVVRVFCGIGTRIK